MISALEQELKTLKYGDHICPIYESVSDQISQKVGFVKQGLQNGNRCIYVVEDNSIKKSIIAFTEAGINVVDEQKRGALILLTREDTYLKTGQFNSKSMLDFLENAEFEAQQQGFLGLWFLAEMNWVLSANIDSSYLMEFEAKLNEFLLNKKCVIFCQYALKASDLSLIHDVLLTHPHAILDSLICPNPYYMPPELALHSDRVTTAELKKLCTQWWIHQLKESRSAEVGRDIFKDSKSKSINYHNILDSLFNFIAILTKDGVVLDINRSSLKVANLQRRDIVGKQFIETPWWKHSRKTQVQLCDALRRATDGIIVREDFNIMIADNRIIAIDTTFVPILDTYGQVKEVVISGVDVTKRKETEKALQESELLFRQLVENIEEVFWVSDAARSKIIYISPSFEKIWGYTCEQLYADPTIWLNGIHPDDRERVKNSYTELNEQYNEIYRVIQFDGTIRWLRARSFNVNDEMGNISRIVGIVEDITVFRKLETQLYQSQKMEAVGKLAGGISHDFNNLLAVIKGNTGLLANEKTLSKDQAEYINEIEKAANRAADLTRKLLLFSRQKEIKLIDIEVNAIINNVTNMLQRVLGENIHLQVKLSDKSLFIHADPGMIDQILINLVVNARDAMPNGGELIIEARPFYFDESTLPLSPGSRKGTFACISVSDSGMGITAEILPRIFEPFFTTKDVDKGTGLGLSTVYGLVEQHQGWINVYSETGKGTKFCIYLPLIQNAIPEIDAPNKNIEHAKGETILLVEDEASLRSVINRMLIRSGYHVLQAADGVSALNIWSTNSNKIDLLLTDLLLPKEMSGRELANHILRQNPKMKVVYMSGYSEEMAGKDLQLHEGINFLQKPFEAIQLSEILRHKLNK